MTEEVAPTYEVLKIPLNEIYEDKLVVLDSKSLVVLQCPITVEAKIDSTSAKTANLQILRTIRSKVKRLYITTTETSTEELILFFSDKLEVEAAPASSRTLLVDTTDAGYDARDIVRTAAYNNNDNVNNGDTKDSGTITTSGFNKLEVSIYSSHEVTLNLYALIYGTTNWRLIDSQVIAATTGTTIEWSVTNTYMKVEVSNASGANTTTCEVNVNLSTGA